MSPESTGSGQIPRKAAPKKATPPSRGNGGGVLIISNSRIYRDGDLTVPAANAATD
jgi:hypothetical protein